MLKALFLNDRIDEVMEKFERIFNLERKKVEEPKGLNKDKIQLVRATQEIKQHE